jgi:hypothetical protein
MVYNSQAYSLVAPNLVYSKSSISNGILQTHSAYLKYREPEQAGLLTL